MLHSAIIAWYFQTGLSQILLADVVEAHCYVVDIGQTDREQIRSRINNN